MSTREDRLLGSNLLAGQQDVYEVAEQQHLVTLLLVSKMFSKLLNSNIWSPSAGQQDVLEVAEQQHLGSRLPACRLRSLAFPPLMTGCLAATILLISKTKTDYRGICYWPLE